jgi:MoxR-like ATPase
VLNGRGYVVPNDVKAVAVGCLGHRILVSEADDDGRQAAAVIRELLETIPAPRP